MGRVTCHLPEGMDQGYDGMNESLKWLADGGKQGWQANDVLGVIDWFQGMVEGTDWLARMEKVERHFSAAQSDWASSRRSSLFDPEDRIAWYVFQARAYALPEYRHQWFEPEAFRIVPLFIRLNQIKPDLEKVDGTDKRLKDLLLGNGRKQPDDGFFELLVAGAYRRRGWPLVSFVETTPGKGATHDLAVARDGQCWAVECKRINRSGYEIEEKDRADALAIHVHRLCEVHGRSIDMDVEFKKELHDIADTYLVKKLRGFLRDRHRNAWSDEVSEGRVRDVDWHSMQAVLAHDDIFYGSSRMIELLVGHFDPRVDHCLRADWIPATRMPMHATSVRQASVVSWKSVSEEARRRKAKHFLSTIAGAARQLPGTMPGVIHVGYESTTGNSAEDLRHERNAGQIKSFDGRESNLRCVYGNYFAAEHTTNPDESAAVSETMVPYPVGPHSMHPLPGHLLFVDEGHPGHHW